MKQTYIFTICSAVYIAPHVSAPVGIIISIYMCVMALYHAWKES